MSPSVGRTPPGGTESRLKSPDISSGPDQRTAGEVEAEADVLESSVGPGTVAVTVFVTVAVAVAVSTFAAGELTPAAGRPMKPTRKVRTPVTAVMRAATAVQCSGVFLTRGSPCGGTGGLKGGGGVAMNVPRSAV